MVLTTYDRYLNLIVEEKESNKIPIKRIAKIVSVDSNTMSKYLYQGVRMPADVMFAVLIAFGYSVEVTKNA